MRSPNQLVHSRARLRPRYALFPLEGYPLSRLPLWPEAEARILTSPAMGAGFAQYKIELTAGNGTRQASDGRTQTFIYLLDGGVTLAIDGTRFTINTGGFALVPHTAAFELEALTPTSLLLVRKAYEAAPGVAAPQAIVGNERDVAAQPFAGNGHARLQLLIPDELPYDLAMNLFTFDPGHGLPYVETHVMEHGLYFLAGKGMYFLGDEWIEVEQTDFIWMGPYCPQSFYATGPTPAKYIYYKNVNREIVL